MALVSCRECGHSVETFAKRCPSCGAKKPGFGAFRYAFSRVWNVVLVLLGLWLVLYLLDSSSSVAPSGSTSASAGSRPQELPTVDSPAASSGRPVGVPDGAFSATVRAEDGQLTMWAYRDSSWDERIRRAGARDEYAPVVVHITNRSSSDVRFHTMTDKFAIIGADGTQYAFVVPSGLRGLSAADESKVWDFYTDVYAQAKSTIVVFFPADLPPMRGWQRVIYTPSVPMPSLFEKDRLFSRGAIPVRQVILRPVR